MQEVRNFIRRVLGVPSGDVASERDSQRFAYKRSRERDEADDDDDDEDEPTCVKRYRTVRSHFPKIMPKEREEEWTIPRAASGPKVRHVPIIREDGVSFFKTGSRPSGQSSPLLSRGPDRRESDILDVRKWRSPGNRNSHTASSFGFGEPSSSSSSEFRLPSFGSNFGCPRPGRFFLEPASAQKKPANTHIIDVDQDEDEEDDDCKYVEVVEPSRSFRSKSRSNRDSRNDVEVIDLSNSDYDVILVKKDDQPPENNSNRNWKIREAANNLKVNKFFKSRNSSSISTQMFPKPNLFAKTYRQSPIIKSKLTRIPKLSSQNSISASFRLDEKKSFEELIARTKLQFMPKSMFAKKLQETSKYFSKTPTLERPSSGIVDLTEGTDKEEKLTNGLSNKTSSLQKITENDSLKTLKRLDEIEKDIMNDDAKPPTPKLPETKIENRLEVLMRHKQVIHSKWIDELKKKYDEISIRKENEVEKIEEGIEIIDDLTELTDEQEAKVDAALRQHPQDEVLIEKFNLSIHRRDIATLSGLNWLNDEVINFYMNLIMERSKANEKLPKVYCMNTFFLPRLMQAGHAGLKRWTRKVDIFSYDLMMVPVHLGVHWCMSVIDFKNQNIKYYDSMGGKNMECCMALLKYLEDEKMDKKREKFDKSRWKLECVKDIPQQMNGSDCGMFSCMFAEYISRNAPITFTQNDMPYFRRKMILEIIEGQLIV